MACKRLAPHPRIANVFVAAGKRCSVAEGPDAIMMVAARDVHAVKSKYSPPIFGLAAYAYTYVLLVQARHILVSCQRDYNMSYGKTMHLADGLRSNGCPVALLSKGFSVPQMVSLLPLHGPLNAQKLGVLHAAV